MDQVSGDIVFKVLLFVVVSLYLGLMYVMVVVNEKMLVWIECYVKVLNYFGKLLVVIVLDNVFMVIYWLRKYLGYWMVIDCYVVFVDYYGVMIVLIWFGRLCDKVVVECVVKIVYIKIFGYFSNEVFYSFDEFNEVIVCCFVDINSVMMWFDGLIWCMCFDKEEVLMMWDLLLMLFMEVFYKWFKVDCNWYIICDYQYYLVLFQLVGELVIVRFIL